VLIAAWEVLVNALEIEPFLLPPPSTIARTFWEKRAVLFDDARTTLLEVIWGFAIALLIAVVLATMISESKILRRAIYPLVVASQTIPSVAIAPLILIWFGFGIYSKIAVAAWIAFFPMVINIATGLTSLEGEIERLMFSFPASRWKIFTKARVPHALPYAFAGMKIGVVLCIIGAVVGEFVGSDAGLGHYIVQQNAFLETASVFAAVLALSLLGIALFLLVGLIERLSIPWYFATRGEAHR
jgi:NitT/TauT family transport system permease protein